MNLQILFLHYFLFILKYKQNVPIYIHKHNKVNNYNTSNLLTN